VKPSIFHPDASDEFTRAIEYYAGIRSELGERFNGEIQRLVGRSVANPTASFELARRPVGPFALAQNFIHVVQVVRQFARINRSTHPADAVTLSPIHVQLRL
jgi:hypothetical protein